MRQFTRAFKIPVLVGKIEGFSLPGGPYTLTQLVVTVLVFVLACWLRPLWGHWGVLDFAAAAAGAAPCGFLAGKLSFGARDPLAIASSVLAGLVSPRFGRHQGRPVRWPAPRPGRAARPGAARVLVIGPAETHHPTAPAAVTVFPAAAGHPHRPVPDRPPVTALAGLLVAAREAS